MTLDATAREANFRDSMKKYLVDSLETAEGIPVLFDSSLVVPNIRGRNVDRWYKISYGSMEFSDMSEALMQVVCCTREDSEGFKLAQLRDKVMGYLTDTDGDGVRRITFYQSSAINPWVKIGGIVVQSIREAGEGFAEDKTKYKILLVNLRFASKI